MHIIGVLPAINNVMYEIMQRSIRKALARKFSE